MRPLHHLAVSIFAAACILGALPASATVISDFDGLFAPSNWNVVLSPGGDGSVEIAAAPDGISLHGNNHGAAGLAFVDFTIESQFHALVTFDWVYATTDIHGPFWDPFGYLLNGEFIRLTGNEEGDIAQGGTTLFEVRPGDVFGFRQASIDSLFGPAVTHIGSFSITVIPEPESMGLLAIGLLFTGGFFLRRCTRQ